MSVTSPDPTPNAAPTPVIRRARAAEASIISAMAVWSLMACHLLTDRLSGAHPDTLPRLAEAVGLAEAVALFAMLRAIRKACDMISGSATVERMEPLTDLPLLAIFPMARNFSSPLELRKCRSLRPVTPGLCASHSAIGPTGGILPVPDCQPSTIGRNSGTSLAEVPT